MKPITIKQAANLLNKEVEKGYGEFILLVSDDEEGNGFHPLFEPKIYAGNKEYSYLNQETKQMEKRGTLVIL